MYDIESGSLMMSIIKDCMVCQVGSTMIDVLKQVQEACFCSN